MDYRITDYGAVADGTTNNRAAIQAAVDALYSGRRRTCHCPDWSVFKWNDRIEK